MIVTSVYLRAAGWMLGVSCTLGRLWMALELVCDPRCWQLRQALSFGRISSGHMLQVGPFRLEIEHFRGRR